MGSGGSGGEMEAAARGAKEGGGRAIGVTFSPALATRFEGGATASTYLDREIKTTTYLERTLKLIALGDAFICFNGGTGTILEGGIGGGVGRVYLWRHKMLGLLGEVLRGIVHGIYAKIDI